MPELPEVEVTRRGLVPGLVGQVIVNAWTSGLALRETESTARLKHHLVGQMISALNRRAKYMLLRCRSAEHETDAPGPVLRLHLGMSGKLALRPVGSPRHRHDHLELALENGMALRFNDARRFGGVLLWPGKSAAACEQAFSESAGLEPLGPDFTAENLAALAANRATPLKMFLMNSHLIAGIGNIYASEILFAAHQHPERPAGQLALADWAHIATETRRILAAAIEAGGSTIADFLGADGHPGYFQLQLKVYGRKNGTCPDCGAKLTQLALSGRSTWFCPKCQALPKSPGGRGKKEDL